MAVARESSSDGITTGESTGLRTQAGRQTMSEPQRRPYAGKPDRQVEEDPVARLFGFDPVDADRGMSVSHYMERIDAEDRARGADVVREAVTSGMAYQATYPSRGRIGRRST
jgi:hypothetical protein